MGSGFRALDPPNNSAVSTTVPKTLLASSRVPVSTALCVWRDDEWPCFRIPANPNGPGANSRFLYDPSDIVPEYQESVKDGRK